MVATRRRLTVTDHDRGAAGMTYVYPVVSRRAGGVSIGINLNPNNACNWRCVYCQVPGLVRGAAPPIDLERLDGELREMLRDVVHGDFLERCVPEGARRLNDVAFSGNGEPTTSADLGRAVGVVRRALADHALLGRIKVVLITNGSMLGKASVARALEEMAPIGGEVWFKLDSATAGGLRRVNGAATTPAAQRARLRRAAALCPTWIQTCLFAWDGAPPPEEEQRAYLDTIRTLAADAAPVRGVLLYTVARPSMQPEAGRVTALPEAWLRDFARQIEEAGLPARVSP